MDVLPGKKTLVGATGLVLASIGAFLQGGIFDLGHILGLVQQLSLALVGAGLGMKIERLFGKK